MIILMIILREVFFVLILLEDNVRFKFGGVSFWLFVLFFSLVCFVFVFPSVFKLLLLILVVRFKVLFQKKKRKKNKKRVSFGEICCLRPMMKTD